MNYKQRNHLAMFMAVQHVFKTYPTELSVIKALEGFIAKFNELLTQINEVYRIQQGHTTGSSKLKLKEEAEMIEATVHLAAAMYVFAQVTEAPDLQAKCAVSVSLLEKMPDQTLLAACLNIYNEAIKLGDALSEYGKSPDDIARTKKEIDDFSVLISSPRSAIVTRSQATKELALLIDEANDLLRNKVDKLMELLKVSQAKVYNTYRSARVIVDLRGGKKVEEFE